MTINRRQFIASGAAAIALGTFASLFAAETKPRFQNRRLRLVHRKMADPAALEVAKQIGLDGVQVSLGTVVTICTCAAPRCSSNTKTQPKSWRRGVVAGHRRAEQHPLQERPAHDSWVSDSIDVCRAMNCRVILARVFHHDDLRNAPVERTRPCAD